MSSQAGISSGRLVSWQSSGMTPSSFCRARTASPHWLLDGMYRQASLTNRLFVSMTWGGDEGGRTANLESPRVRVPFDDPALAHACRARGGAPEAIDLEWIDNTPGPPGAPAYLGERASVV